MSVRAGDSDSVSHVHDTYFHNTCVCMRLHYTKYIPSLFPCDSTSFTPHVSLFLRVALVEHHISLKRVTPKMGAGCTMQDRIHQHDCGCIWRNFTYDNRLYIYMYSLSQYNRYIYLSIYRNLVT